jgi:ABC-type nitrate/sulfonate/bicarbonate transport system substrate-binding protein
MNDSTAVRIASGLRGTTHLMTWIGNDTGVFARYGLSVTFPTLTSGGPESVRAMVAGEWDFVHTGTVPIAESVLNGGDAVILARNTDEHVSIFVMTLPEIESLAQLEGRKVGVLTDAYSGQTGVITRKAIEQAGARAEYVGLGSYEAIYDALAAGEVAGGALQIDRRFLGQRAFGWNAFPTSPLGLTSVFATTRRKIATEPVVVARTLQALVDSIALFKSQPDVAVPALQRALKLDDADVAADIHRYYVPFFPDWPHPTMATAIAPLRALFRDRYPAADRLTEVEISDPSPLRNLERKA